MSFDISQIKEAYIKLKSYIYYDNTDILLRRKLVEYESNLTKEGLISSFGKSSPSPYVKTKGLFQREIIKSVELKLELLTKAINEYHNDPKFIDYFLSFVDVDLYPKKFKEETAEENFITNERVKDDYIIDRLSAFINAPIELHIISVLWIMEIGKSLDNDLDDSCMGNRLLLNKSDKSVIKGSGLFKPYHKQYQKWRDDSVNVAQSILNDKKNVLFLNLDIRDYFHSVRIRASDLYEREAKYPTLQYWYNLKEIFLKIHIRYTELAGKKYNVPYGFCENLKKDAKGQLLEVVLPIGLVSSFVLANSYLKEFDDRIIQKIKPAYYGRYVDDILIVISDPKPDYHKTEKLGDIKFSFDKYKIKVNDEGSFNENECITFKETDLKLLENYVLQNFYPVLKLIDSPQHISPLKKKADEIDKVFKLSGYPSLFCQSKKSLVYFFNYEESDLVIDKLKKDLEDKSSEFRDFPDEKNNEETFEENAFHLMYDSTEGKVRTLKDYKENRYGLTVYLANKIFSALRHEKKITETEKDQVLKFFRGINCLEFYRLWERIFTFFLVNEHAEAYVLFYLHCFQQIENIKSETKKNAGQSDNVINTLAEYLDCAHEITLSLNPAFISNVGKAARHFEFQLNKIKSEFPSYGREFEPTTTDAFWGRRFRITNMIRHHYVIHPLLNYTEEAKNGSINLTTLKLNIKKFALENSLLENSPRVVKFWECCVAIALSELSKFNKSDGEKEAGYVSTNTLGLKFELDNEANALLDFLDADEVKEASSNPVYKNLFQLNLALDLYKKINSRHIPTYDLDDENFSKQFFEIKVDPVEYDKTKETKVQEIRINSKDRLNEPKIAFANTEVLEDNIIRSLRGNPNLGFERYQNLSSILKQVREEDTDILLFPEFFIPINLLSSIVRYSEKNQLLTVTGLEHITVDGTAFNFIVTILPVENNGIKDAVVVFRLKNHYAHGEEALIDGNHLIVPKPTPYRYDIFIWRNIYFAPYYCFELANALHRSLMKGKIDLLVGVEWNKDTPYFSNIVEAGSRDLHAYVAQVNTSQFGDTRLTQPVETARKDILRLKGGINDAVLVAKINIAKLREFQRQKFSLTHGKAEYKPLPPDFSLQDVLTGLKTRVFYKEPI